jgi:beta-1,4-mannosyl-glycoprotein beta-1,4-N-acetylglucosaminyltransferase
MYNNEAILLLIRLRTLSPLVDWFILGYSNTTFTGRDSQPLSFAPHEAAIGKFSAQLVPLWFDVRLAGDDPWVRPQAARDHLLEGVKALNPQPDDLVMIGDLDEFVLPGTVAYLRENPPRTFIRLQGYGFFASSRLQDRGAWARNGIVRYGAIDHHLSWYRKDAGPRLPGLRSLHCSYCFGRIRDVIRKFRSASHTELSTGKHVDPNYIVARVACSQKPFGGNGHMIVRERGADMFGIDLPPEAEALPWRLPFTDLDEVELDVEKVKAMAACEVKVVDGKIRGDE